VREIGHYIGGRMVAGRSGRTQAVFDPATGSSDAMVALASSADMNEAVAAAKAAWPD
jgi:malonate-semialdehyde dehydrogenase (acetylating)/methylmalonate-semialdehyde dehydrogenase